MYCFVSKIVIHIDCFILLTSSDDCREYFVLFCFSTENCDKIHDRRYIIERVVARTRS
jgi:hypothetical protein